MFCQKCGFNYNDGLSFCPNCGTAAGSNGTNGMNFSSQGGGNFSQKINNLGKYQKTAIIFSAISIIFAIINVFLNSLEVLSYDGLFEDTTFTVSSALDTVKSLCEFIDYTEGINYINFFERAIDITYFLIFASIIFLVVRMLVKKKFDFINWIPITLAIFINDALHIGIAISLYGEWNKELADTVFEDIFELLTGEYEYIGFSIITIFLLIFNCIVHSAVGESIFNGKNSMGAGFNNAQMGAVNMVAPPQPDAFDKYINNQFDDVPQTMPAKNVVMSRPKTADIPGRQYVGVVECLSGEYMGARFNVGNGEQLTIGKDASTCNIIVNPNEAFISRRHCTVSYNSNQDCYTIVDHSTNGTFVNGNKIQTNYQIQLQHGTIINLGNANNSFKLL